MLTKWTVLAKFFLLLILVASEALSQENLPALIKKIQPSVVTVTVYDSSGDSIGQGSGFFVSKAGDLVTNHHVVKGASRIEVRTSDGKFYSVKRVVAIQKAADLVRLSVNIPRSAVNPLVVSRRLPEVGQRVIVIGSPLGFYQTVSDGIVSAVRDVSRYGNIIQITAPVSSGSSGSPVVNMKGEVIGVATLASIEGQNINFAIPGERVLALGTELKLGKELKELRAEREKLETERKRLEEERRKAEDKRRRAEEEKRRAEAERRRLEEAKREQKEKREAKEKLRRKVGVADRIEEQAGMVYVPAGEFWMGCNEKVDSQCEASEKPGRTIYLDAFRIDKYEVTVAEYRRCVQAGRCSSDALEMPYWSGKERSNWAWACNWGKGGREDHPINCVDWDQAKTYCEWTEKRLPTEAEWEKAARGTKWRKYPWGNTRLQDAGKVANIADESFNEKWPNSKWVEGYYDGYTATAPVGWYPDGASPYGALDMIGNVREWVADWYDDDYYQRGSGRNPKGPNSGKYRVLRGGSWGDTPGARTSARYWVNPRNRSVGDGFRCVR